MDDKYASIHEINAEQAQEIRRLVLRPHQAIEMSIYPLDDELTTFHAGAFADDVLVGVASVFNEAPGGSLGANDWRIRGMATLESVRGAGYGAALLARIIGHVMAMNGDDLWCNARTSAAGFYRKYGFEASEPEYELPGLGPHLRMFKSLHNPSEIESNEP